MLSTDCNNKACELATLSHNNESLNSFADVSFCVNATIDNNKHTFQSLSVAKTNEMLWHKRLGHPNANVLSKILHILKLNNIVSHTFDFCTACQFGKLHQSVFPRTNSRAFQPLELIHSDLWGLSPISSPKGFRHYI